MRYEWFLSNIITPQIAWLIDGVVDGDDMKPGDARGPSPALKEWATTSRCCL